MNNEQLQQFKNELLEEMKKVYPDTKEEVLLVSTKRGRIETWLNHCWNGIDEGITYFNKIRKDNMILDFEVLIEDSDNTSDLTIYIYGWDTENKYFTSYEDSVNCDFDIDEMFNLDDIDEE